MTAIAQLDIAIFDAPDIDRVGSFYAELTGWEVVRSNADRFALGAPNGEEIEFQRAPDHVAPEWPGQVRPQQFHLDLQIDDHQAAAERAVTLGATRLADGASWVTLTDPAGHPFDLCQADVEGTKVFAVTIDTDDAPALGRFYSALLGLDLTYEGPEGVLIGREGEQVMFQQVAELQRPRWPDPTYPQQLHLDITVDDADEAELAALALGAERLPGDGENWRVYADPHGHPFCLLTGVL